MSEHVVYKKKKICFTEVSDFTDFQGIGADPLYKRYDSVQAVMRTCIDPKYISFLAQPIYNPDQDTIDWYVEEWTEHPIRMVDLNGAEKEHYKRILDTTVQHYRNAAMKIENDDLLILGGAIKFISEDMVFCYDNKVVLVCWGMRYDTKKHLDIGGLFYEFEPAPPVIYQVVFNPGESGTLEGSSVVNIPAGTPITADQVPSIKAQPNFTFTGWNQDPVGQEVNADMEFTALYEFTPPAPTPPPPPTVTPQKVAPPPTYSVLFQDGGCGRLNGNVQYFLPAGTPITANMIPSVTANSGYKFDGWDVNPLNYRVAKNMVFTAKYRKKSKWWLWLLLILLALLLFFLLFFLLKGCKKHLPDPEIVQPSENTPVPSQGDVEITLRWEDYNDLDLHCIDPTGEEIDYTNKRAESGGRLEYDKNNDPSNMSRTPMEHIFWPTSRAPRGHYIVKVVFYSQNEQSEGSSYSLRIKYGDKEENYTGTVSETNNPSMTYRFTF